MQSKLIIISNRLPFKIEKRNGKLEIRQSSGGLVSAMDSAIKSAASCVWVGAADFSEELWREYNSQLNKSEIVIRPIFLERKLEKGYYQGFSNSIIWPLFHYFPSFAVYKEEYYSAYTEVNEIFYQRLSEILEPNDKVWVHDYQLMILPRLIRQKHTSVGIGFFLHIPFPSYEILKHIPESWRTNILTSLLHADVIGFQTQEYVSHFERTLSFFLGLQINNETTLFEGNRVVIKQFPISIDFEKFNSAFDEKSITKGRAQIKSRYKDVKIIFSVDRLDYTKGVINRLEAFESLLETSPDLRQKVTFIINVVPSRDKHKKYSERRKLIEERISHINGLYGDYKWTPIIYQYSHLTFAQLVSFYTACDVALVTPLRDGMNLVAKEFVASRKDKSGVLVLSEFAGAVNELGSAILVNPNDNNLMKKAMLDALSYAPALQELAMTAMQETLSANTVSKWCSDFLGELNRNNHINNNQKTHLMNFDEKIEIVDMYRRASKRLILLDYDGTLVPYFNDPALAVPDNRTKELLNTLISDTRNKVLIISGRDTETLQKWFADIPVDLVAEHGAYYKNVSLQYWTKPAFNSDTWKSGVKDIFTKYSKDIPGSFVEEKNHAVTWHYRNSELPDEDAIISNVCKDLVIHNSTNQYNVLCGNKIIEAKNINFDKGVFVTQFLKDNEFDFVLAIGDDATDEDMFDILTGKEHITIRVGLKNTNARYNLIGVNNVYSLLEQLSAFKQLPVDISQVAS